MINGSDLKPLVLYFDGFVCMQLVKLVHEIAMSFVVTNTHSSKWDIAKNLLLQVCDLCDSTVLLELLFPSWNQDSYPFPPLPHLIASNIGVLPKALVSL
jgi:hypothetical protein